jgi:PAS domain S-box-containing protein
LDPEATVLWVDDAIFVIRTQAYSEDGDVKLLTPDSIIRAADDANGDLKFLLALSQVQITVRQVMTPRVMTVQVQESMAETAAKMAGQGVSCAVVVAGDQVQGMLTHKDFLYGLANHGQALYQRAASDQMSTPVCTVHPECSILDSCRFMERERIRRLPVLEGDTLVGLVTQTDLTRALTAYGAFREVSEIMTPAVVTVHMEDTLDVALAHMAQHRISCIVVVSGEHPVGILTERDVLSKITSRQMNPQRIRVEDVMSSPLTHIESSCSIHSAARMMDQRRFHRLVVMEAGQLRGVVTQSDIFRAAHRKLLMEETNRYRLMARSLTSTFVLDREGQVVYVNPAFTALLEIEDDRTLRGTPFLPDEFWVYPEERQSALDLLYGGDAMVDPMVLRTQQGAVRYVRAVTTSTLDAQGNISGTQGVLYDNTALFQAENALRQANEKLEAARQELKSLQDRIQQYETPNTHLDDESANRFTG